MSQWDLVEKLIDAYVRVLDKHGLAVALSTLFVASTLGLCWYLLKVALKSKDDEIKRLVKLRDELWKQHVSTLPKSGFSEVERKKASRKTSPRRRKPND